MSNKSNSRQHGLVGNKRPISRPIKKRQKLSASSNRSVRRQITDGN